MQRRRLKAVLARLEPERLRGAWLARRIRRLPRAEYRSAGGRMPLRPGLRRVILGDRSGLAAGPSPYHAQLLDALVARYGIGPDARVVEVGCHDGALLDRLARAGWRRLRGVDYAPYHGSELERARSRAGVEIDMRGIERAELADCDLVYSFDTFEHVADWRGFLERVWRGLAPGGVAYVHYNAFAGINGAHSAGTVDVPWGHVLLKEHEHLELVRSQDPPAADANVEFVRSRLNRVDLASVSRALAELGARGVVLPKASAGDRLLFRELFEGFPTPFLREELFVREVEIFLSRR